MRFVNYAGVLRAALWCIALLMVPFAGAQHHQSGKVVASIGVLHSLVQGIMGDTGEAILLQEGNISPHGYQLKPSQIRALQSAHLIFYIDDDLERYLLRALASTSAEAIAVTQADGLTILAKRQPGLWNGGEQGDDDWHDDDDGHNHAANDPHIWLDTENAKKIVLLITEKLTARYPQNGQIYARNGVVLSRRIDQLDAQLKAQLVAVKDVPFVVFHDAYQYFERRYQLNAIASLVINPDYPPSLKKLQSVRDRIQQTGVVCVFREPQFSDRWLQTITAGTAVKGDILDPLGSTLATGPDLYFNLLQAMAVSIKRCLTSHR